MISATISFQRNIGVDLLRIVAMAMIVLGHVVRFCFNYYSDEVNRASLNFIILDALANLCYVGVNVYAMVSGYVMVRRHIAYIKLLSLWAQLFFVSTTVVFLAKIAGISVSPQDWLTCLMPIYKNSWWYMTAYFGMFAFLPFINLALKHASRHEIKLWGIFLFIIFSILPSLMRQRNLFGLNEGYSAYWLLICYTWGGMANLLQDDI